MDSKSDNYLKFDGNIYYIGEGETALDAMLRGGANLNFSCRRGTCHTCMLEIVSGEVGPEGQEKLSQEKREHNLFLPCVTRYANKLEAKLPDLSKYSTNAMVAEKNRLSENVWQCFLSQKFNGTGERVSF